MWHVYEEKDKYFGNVNNLQGMPGHALNCKFMFNKDSALCCIYGGKKETPKYSGVSGGYIAFFFFFLFFNKEVKMSRWKMARSFKSDSKFSSL